MKKYILILVLFFTVAIAKSQVKLLTLSELETRIAKGSDTTYVINFWATSHWSDWKESFFGRFKRQSGFY